jgi:thiol-disulfide isomerase/thioredoxin
MIQRILRSVVFLSLFFIFIRNDDYLDLFLYHTTPLSLAWAYMAARMITTMMLFIPITDWLNHQDEFFAVTFRYTLAILIIPWLIFGFSYTDLFFYRGKVIANAWLAIPFLLIAIFSLIKVPQLAYKKKLYLSIFALIATLVIPQVISPPDLLPGSNFANTLNQDINLSQDEFSIIDFEAQNQLICFYIAGCPFCKMAAQKINDWASKHEIPFENIKAVIPGNEAYSEKYFNLMGLHPLETQNLSPETFNRITGGRVPLILHMQHGKIKATYRFRDFHDLSVLQTWNNP